jgi:DNA repair exonuclease SbcCD ATPase subunit
MLERALKDKDAEVNPYIAQIKDIKEHATNVDTALKLGKTEVEKLGRKIVRAQFWVKGFKDVRLYIIEEVLQELELATNAALEDVGLLGWEVKYDIEKETKSGTIQRGLNVTILRPGLKERVRWESWSGGEGQRLRVVGALSLSEVLLDHAGVRTSLEVLDEPAHFMAPDGVRDLTDYLAWRAQGLERSTFYIDHMSIDSARFTSVMTVTKTKDGAHVSW